MEFYAFAICMIITIKPALSYKIDVSLEDEGMMEDVEFEITKTRTPTFETNVSPDEGFQDFTMGPVVTGNLGNARGKRSLDNTEVCMYPGDQEEGTDKTLVVEEGEDFHLPCHNCGENENEKFEPLQWIKLDLIPNSKGHYHIKEVVSGMREDDARNRILITVDHRLIIKEARISDSGNYFCTRRVTQILNMWLNWTDLQNWIVQNLHLKYYFHVDVLKLISDRIVDVSEYSGIKPGEQEVVPDLNIVMETTWHPWGECNVCGQEGLRKRVGICVVKKLKKGSSIPNSYIDKLLMRSETRLPCESQLLIQLDYVRIHNRPNEVQIEECLVPCVAPDFKRNRRSISTSELLTGEKKGTGKSKEKSVTDGDYLILVCPGSSITSNPVWVNGTDNIPMMELKKKSSSRISFDPLGNLIFAPVGLADAGTFSCWLKQKMIRKFKVKVKADVSGEAVEYSLYMCYVLLADLGVFVMLSVVKFMNRKVQVRRKRETETKFKDSSDEEGESLVTCSSESS